MAGSGRNPARRFANGELIGEAERAGNPDVQYIVAAKGIDQDHKKLFARIIFSVKDCRKRMNAWGA